MSETLWNGKAITELTDEELGQARLKLESEILKKHSKRNLDHEEFLIKTSEALRNEVLRREELEICSECGQSKHMISELCAENDKLKKRIVELEEKLNQA